MTTRKPRKAARSRKSDKAQAPIVSPRRALRLWGPSVRLHLEAALAEAADGMTTAAILQKMASDTDPLDRGQVEMMARHLFFHCAKTGDAARAASKMLGVVESGGWEGGAR